MSIIWRSPVGKAAFSFPRTPISWSSRPRGVSHAGLAYCHQNTRSVGEIVRALELLWEIYEPAEMIDRVEFL